MTVNRLLSFCGQTKVKELIEEDTESVSDEDYHMGLPL